MSCTKCDDAQMLNPINRMPEICTFIRVGAANVMISGCEEHLVELIRIYRKGLAESEKESK